MNAVLACSSVTSNPNAEWLGQIVQAALGGNSCLPLQLGLELAQWQAFGRNYPQLQASLQLAAADAHERMSLRSDLLEMRRDEWLELRDLLLAGRSGASVEEEWLAAIIAAACMGGDHLWRDLGMRERPALKALLRHNFPVLAARNDKDMRWKRFFYKQLCEQGGHYVCRAPSCEQCSTHHECFGEES